MDAITAQNRHAVKSLVHGLEVSPEPRATVLPRVEVVGEVPRLTASATSRYEKVSALGEGTMGEVSRVFDRDIGRTVAMKRLKENTLSHASLARFTEEIRTIGQLEHPNIVPIHDVGLDEEGQYYFMMKYVEGETLETAIEQLRAGDPDAHRRYTIERRVEIFLSLLEAMRFAHTRGIAHRDLKPSNIMIGRFGEVMVMDWGVAKKIRNVEGDRPDLDRVPQPSAEAPTPSDRAELFRTRHGTLIGTPAYMSPEQARGDTDQIDERSDIYALCVILKELLTLDHYLGDKKTVISMLLAISGEAVTLGRWEKKHPAQKALAVTWLQYAYRGINKDPAQRFQSVDEMRAEAERVLEGRCRVVCHVSLMKRLFGEAGRFVDRHPHGAALAFLGGSATLVYCAVRGLLA